MQYLLFRLSTFQGLRPEGTCKASPAPRHAFYRRNFRLSFCPYVCTSGGSSAHSPTVSSIFPASQAGSSHSPSKDSLGTPSCGPWGSGTVHSHVPFSSSFSRRRWGAAETPGPDPSGRWCVESMGRGTWLPGVKPRLLHSLLHDLPEPRFPVCKLGSLYISCKLSISS